jgi:hypothetical protein
VQIGMLTDADLPPIFHAADRSSSEAQAWFLWGTRIRLYALLGAALFGLLNWKHAPSPVDWSGVMAASCFVIALVVEAYLYRANLERTWYEGRAVAESVRTLSWRYAVGGEPFMIGGPSETQVATRFLKDLMALFEAIKDLNLAPATSSGEQITQNMRMVRASSLADRKDLYERGRVEDQQTWYQHKAEWNKQRAQAWTVAMLVVEIIGIVGGILKAVGSIDGDLLGFAGVVVATMTAWLQTKQHRTLTTAYTVTAVELASVRSELKQHNTEAAWAKFVHKAEEAFSREHTLWKARRAA